MARGPSTTVPAEEVQALVELVDQQQATLDALRHARAAHARVLTEAAMLRQVMAHELANPLAVVRGALEAMRRDTIDAEARATLIASGLRQTAHLQDVMSDLLALPGDGELEAARAAQIRQSVAALVHHALESVRAHHDLDGVSVHVHPSVGIRTVPNRFRRLVANLVTNAVRHGGTPIEVSATVVDASVRLEVADRGPGVEPAEADAVFAPYSRGETSAPDGLGLGLYIVRSLATSLGGTVTLEARSGGGTRAVVELPQHRASDPVEVIEPAVDGADSVGAAALVDLTADDLAQIRGLQNR